jgi:hypothetical protein
LLITTYSNGTHLRRDLVALAVAATSAANSGAVLIVLNVIDGAHVPVTNIDMEGVSDGNWCVKQNIDED